MRETTKQIIISTVKLVKSGIRINYEKYRDSCWVTTVGPIRRCRC